MLLEGSGSSNALFDTLLLSLALLLRHSALTAHWCPCCSGVWCCWTSCWHVCQCA